VRKIKKNNKHDYLEVFLFCSALKHPKKAADFARFFTNLNDLDSQLADGLVFLNLPAALQYSRFMNTNHVIFRAYVHQLAIEGHSNGLGLKRGFLLKEHLHGCFPGWAKGELYVTNPYFDEKYAIAV